MIPLGGFSYTVYTKIRLGVVKDHQGQWKSYCLNEHTGLAISISLL